MKILKKIKSLFCRDGAYFSTFLSGPYPTVPVKSKDMLIEDNKQKTKPRKARVVAKGKKKANGSTVKAGKKISGASRKKSK